MAVGEAMSVAAAGAVAKVVPVMEVLGDCEGRTEAEEEGEGRGDFDSEGEVEGDLVPSARLPLRKDDREDEPEAVSTALREGSIGELVRLGCSGDLLANGLPLAVNKSGVDVTLGLGDAVFPVESVAGKDGRAVMVPAPRSPLEEVPEGDALAGPGVVVALVAPLGLGLVDIDVIALDVGPPADGEGGNVAEAEVVEKTLGGAEKVPPPPRIVAVASAGVEDTCEEEEAEKEGS